MITALTVVIPAVGAEPLLPQLIGQTCRGNTGMFDLVYTIDQKDGQWAVHDLFGKTGSAESTMKDVGWRPATVDGDSLTFQGLSARITLTAKDAHTVAGHFLQTDPARSGVYDYTLTCSTTPADQRWH
jgi:hypothetical protein